MEGIPALYKGRIISKEGFRAFVYMPNGAHRLVESWEEFEKHMQTGIWFATREDAKKSIEVIEESEPKERQKTSPRTSRAKKQAPVGNEEQHDAVEDLAFEVTDNFLPKG